MFYCAESPVHSYHTLRDPRLPPVFTCFNCRIRGDKNWAMIAVNDLLPNMTSKFNDLALFRCVFDMPIGIYGAT